MTETKISRRSALGLIGRTGVAFGAGTCFFLSLKTSPLAASDRRQRVSRAGAPAAPEKVVISGEGPILTARISGPPGRYYGFAWAATDARTAYKALGNAKGRLDKKGQGIVRINAKDLPEGRVFLRIVTAKTASFDEDIAGTEAFVVKVSKGAIAGYEGVLSRPLVSASRSQAVATASAACVGVKRK
jgi:hypothetical protein